MTDSSYDVVVVGGGTAGSVVASRLASSGAEVCLIEEGPSDRAHPEVSDVRNWLSVLGGALDRALPMAPPYSHQAYSTGRVLGGSSSLNNVWAFETPDWDLHRWVADGMSHEQAGSLAGVRPRVRTSMGAVPIADGHPASAAFLEALAETGFGPTDLGHEDLVDGAGWVRMTARGTTRRSAATAYLHERPAERLTVVVDTPVRHVLIGANGRVQGVVTDRETIRTSQVVVCAGSLSTPGLLIRSGIGAADALSRLGAPVRVDQPHVGRHLQDHPLTGVTYRAGTFEPTTRSHGWETAAFAPSAVTGEEHAFCLLFSTTPSPFGMSAESPHLAGGGYTLAAYLSRPRSRGSVRLASTDPADAPLVTAPLLTDPEGLDRAALVEVTELLREIGDKPALARWLADEVEPGRQIAGDDLAPFIGATLGTMFHPTSTCRMGTDPAESVVSEEFSVWGVEGLRVCDASVIPAVPTVPPYLTCVMLAERCSDVMIDDARR